MTEADSKWTLDDIPWERFDRDRVSLDVLAVVKTASVVERNGADYGRYFHDITVGNNDLTASHGGVYPALTGYDMATGLGSPDAAQLAAGLCATTVRLTDPGRLSSSIGRTWNGPPSGGSAPPPSGPRSCG